MTSRIAVSDGRCPDSTNGYSLHPARLRWLQQPPIRPCGAPAGGWNLELATYSFTQPGKSSHFEIGGDKRISQQLSGGTRVRASLEL